MLTFTLVAFSAIAAVALLWPVFQKQRHLAHLDSADPTARARSLESLLPLAREDPTVRARLLNALADLAARTDDIGALQARVAAAWLFRNVPSFRELAESRLEQSEGTDRFAAFARVLILGGQWDVPNRSVRQRARWLAHQCRCGEAPARVSALHRMGALGPAAERHLADVLTEALADDSAQVREEAIFSTAIVLQDRCADLLQACLDDSVPSVRRRAVLMLSTLPIPADPVTALADGLGDPEPTIREAAAWALARASRDVLPPRARSLLAELLRVDSEPCVRGMAALAARDPDRLLERVLEDNSILVRARCQWSLREPLTPVQWERLLCIAQAEPKFWVALSAVAAVGRCARNTSGESTSAPASRIRDVLLDRLERSLQTGEDALAAACLESLAALGDPATLPLFKDIATRLPDRPRVALSAARAAGSVDASTAAPLLLELLKAESAPIRDLATYELTQLPAGNRPLRRLRDALGSPNQALRGSAALALAVFAAQRGRDEPELTAYLNARTTREHPRYETRLPLRGYYLCALFLLGRHEALPEIRTLLLAGEIPPTTAGLAFLCKGDRKALDLPLLDPTAMGPGFDARVFFCKWWFGDILPDFFPDAPRVDWRFDPQLQTWQVDRLRDWWRVHRWDQTTIHGDRRSQAVGSSQDDAAISSWPSASVASGSWPTCP